MPGLPTVDSDGSASDGDESEGWPTPNMMDGLRAGKENDPSYWIEPATRKAAQGIRKQFPLNIAAQIGFKPEIPWPTPTSGDGDSSGNRNLPGSAAHPGTSLTDATVPTPANWATPAARDFRHPNAADGASRAKREAECPASGDQLPNQIGGALNPAWTCLLMGWPIARRDDGSWWCWTSFEPAPTHAGFPGWPMGMGPYQHPYEPPRIAPKGSIHGRVAQIKAVGNGVCPQQAYLAYSLLLAPAAAHLQAQP